jgi:hypothetical protein
MGSEALTSLTSGASNTAVGREALKSLTGNNNNTAVGYRALQLSTADGNTAVGYQAGQAGTAITSGTYNTFLGYQAQSNNNSYTNGMALGNGAVLTASNRIVLGNTSIAAIYAQVTAITAISDARRKRDIADLPIGLDFIDRIKTHQYRFNNGDETLRFGVIAQELEQALPASLRGLADKPDGMALLTHDSDEDHTYRVNYGELTAPMIKAIQDLHQQNKEQAARITALEAALAELRKERAEGH